MEIFVAQKKRMIYMYQKITNVHRLIENFDPKQRVIIAVALGKKWPFPLFSSSVDYSYLTIRKNALETVLFNQRLR